MTSAAELTPTVADPFAGVDMDKLERSLARPRTLLNLLASMLIAAMSLAALVPLLSVIWMLLSRGGVRLGLESLSSLPPAALAAGGGFGNAIAGTIMMVSTAGLITVPAGIAVGLFLAEAAPTEWLAALVRFAAKVLSGFPSILAGVFAYGAVVLVSGSFSALAGAVALAILMLPTIALTTEEAVRTVPLRVREAAVGMGATDSQLVFMVLLPTARAGIVTGVMLAFARAAGETAPLLFTALFSNYWPVADGRLDLMQPTASLAVLIYNFAGVPFANQVELAWAAALVLVLLVLATNLLAQALAPREDR